MPSKVSVSTANGHSRAAKPAWRKRLVWVGLAVATAFVPLSLWGLGQSNLHDTRLTHIVQRSDLIVTATEEGILESSENTEIRCQVRGHSVITWVVASGTYVEPGDELVRLDTLALEETISETTKNAHSSRSAAERSAADVVASELAILEYLKGRYRTEVMTLDKDLTVAQSNQLTAENLLAHAETMAARGYVSELDVEDAKAARLRAALTVAVTKKQREVLTRYTKAMELETLQGNLNEARARHAANVERARMDAIRRDRALQELQYCVMTAEQSGLVIYPRAERWKRAPEIEEGATLYRNQVILLMPNLDRMQVKIGIHESIIKRVSPGLAARIKLPDKTLDGQVVSVAEAAAPAGWWTGTSVTYDTIVELPRVEGLKPGMTALVELTLAQHEDALTLPVNAVLQTPEGTFCWVRTGAPRPERRAVTLGDTDGDAVVVEVGLQAGDEVWLDPLTHLPEAQAMGLRPFDYSTRPRVTRRQGDEDE